MRHIYFAVSVENKNKRIILASASPRRKEILKSLGIRFSVIFPSIKESSSFKRPHLIVKDLARKKALAVAKKLYAAAQDVQNTIIIAADTLVVYRDLIIGKPKSYKHAIKILLKLSGTRHRVYTGLAILDLASRKLLCDYEVSVIKMRKLSLQEIKMVSKRHLDKAGAYAVQEKNDAFVEKIEGDYFNVVGLPVKLLLKMLLRFGVNCRSRMVAVLMIFLFNF